MTTPTKDELLTKMVNRRRAIDAELNGLANDIMVLANLDALEPPVEPDIPEPPVEPEPPTPPVTGPDDYIDVVVTANITQEALATAISEAEPGTRFLVYGELPMIRIGGQLGTAPKKEKYVAHHADHSPIEGITFQGANADAGIAGLLFHNSLGGYDNVTFMDLAIRPRLDGDRACVMCEEHYREYKLQGGRITFDGIRLWAPEDWQAWGGRGVKQAMAMRSSSITYSRMHFACAPQEHWIYDHNHQGPLVFDGLTGDTRIFKTPMGRTVEVGPGRAAIQIVERMTDGLESWGDVDISDVLVRRPSSEGVTNGLTASGAFPFTFTGTKGTIRMRDCRVDEPMTGGVMVAWTAGKGYRDPCIDRLDINGLSWVHGTGPEFANRVPIKISAVGSVKARDVFETWHNAQTPNYLNAAWVDPRIKWNEDPSVHTITPDLVDWA